MSRVLDIVMPYYGDVALMQAAVRSVLAQDTDGWHLTVLDDCMPDDEPRRWATGLADPRLTYLRNERNLGANANYRRVLELAEASHVVVMGADDVMLPHYVATVRRTLEAFPEADVVQPGVAVIDGTGEPVTPLVDRVKTLTRPDAGTAALHRGEAVAAGLLRGNWTYFPSLCWRRDTVRGIGFRPGLDVVQDLALLLDVLMAGGSLLVAPEVAFHYRRHRGSDSSLRAASGSRFAEERAFYRTVADELDALGWSRAARAARLHLTSRLHAASVVPQAVRHRDARAGLQLVRHAVTR